MEYNYYPGYVDKATKIARSDAKRKKRKERKKRQKLGGR